MSTYAFEYARANSVDEALSLLAQHGSEAKLLAGGHSLVPTMKLRLAAPNTLIDISGLSELSGISESGGKIHIGALTTHRMVEHSALLREKCGVLAELAGKIGDPMVRNRGTIGGSLAHADPAADYPAAILILNAEIEIAGPSGRRTVGSDTFFQEMFETAVGEGELLTRITIPMLGPNEGAAYVKFENTASRYAVVGVAALVSMYGGHCQAARIAVTGAAPVAFRATGVEQQLVGKTLDAAAIAAAVKGMVDPANLLDDLSGSASYRAHLCEVMARAAIAKAVERAG